MLVPAATSGRAVLISGITVIVAMAGMFLTGNGIFMGFAEARSSWCSRPSSAR
ncbi:hypothetical protein [Microbispora bryophytorum]|uniref:hypothetical protein n=1 Tax=Microbispora bryophytorum TaxID=1460882 RepID=UPI0033C9CA16